MTTIAQIAADALNAVAAEITDAVPSVLLTRQYQVAYDVASGTYSTASQTSTGRAVWQNIAAAPDMFPDYVIGPSDELFFLEGLTFAPIETDELVIAGVTRIVRAVQDLGGAGTIFNVIAR